MSENDYPNDDVRSMSVEELLESYNEFRDEADHLPKDEPQCVELELIWALANQIFGEGRVQ